jgi:hypothetical protein
VGAEDYQGTGRADVHQLGQHYYAGIHVEPSDFLSHGSPGNCEGKKESQPFAARGDSCTQVVDCGQMPKSPKESESNGGELGG